MIKDKPKREKTYSQRIKEELRKILTNQPDLAIWTLAAFYQVNGSGHNKEICFHGLRKENAFCLRQALVDAYQLTSQISHGKDGYSIQVKLEDKDAFKMSPTSDAARRQMLRAIFLLCGSISDPAVSYHLAFAFHRRNAALLTQTLLSDLDIRSKIISQPDSWLVYIKESQHIAEFLLNTGAHKALLDYESLRVEKELRNNVNRVVNCDSANMQRIADTGTRQTALIRLIHQTVGLSSLPEDLRLTASLRLQHPDYSLIELGDLMEPPLGKSGVYHRLKRLEKISSEIIDKKIAQQNEKD